MKEKLVSIALILGLSLIALAASKEPAEEASNEAQKIQQEELSLKSDREHLNELRKDVPDPIKAENDDLSFMLKLFEDKTRKPENIRSEFNRKFQRLRRDKGKFFKRKRKDFKKAEKKKRKAFLKKQKEVRTAFMKKKPAKDKTKEFYDDQDAKRREFFADAKEKRNDFEADMRASQKDFDSFMRRKRKEFDDHYRQYRNEYRDRQKAKKKANKPVRIGTKPTPQRTLSDRDRQLLKDFKKIPPGPGVPLAPKEE